MEFLHNDKERFSQAINLVTNWMMLPFCLQSFWKLLTLQFRFLYQNFQFIITSEI